MLPLVDFSPIREVWNEPSRSDILRFSGERVGELIGTVGAVVSAAAFVKGGISYGVGCLVVRQTAKRAVAFEAQVGIESH